MHPDVKSSTENPLKSLASTYNWICPSELTDKASICNMPSTNTRTLLPQKQGSNSGGIHHMILPMGDTCTKMLETESVDYQQCIHNCHSCHRENSVLQGYAALLG
jgi:hypothetical protein